MEKVEEPNDLRDALLDEALNLLDSAVVKPDLARRLRKPHQFGQQS